MVEVLNYLFGDEFGYVYFVQIKDHPESPIKVGFTTRSVGVRFKELQQQIPFHKLSFLGSFKGFRSHETKIKQVLRPYRIVPKNSSKRISEWFKAEKPIIDYIVRVLSPTPKN